ncbi:hypothetical protein C0J52_12397 [Blattella germanica]|nr:hypothetical protein C0J52_12397 [Blattella germanica]
MFLLQPQLPRKHAKTTSQIPQMKTKLKYDSSQQNNLTKEVDIELYDALLVDRDNKDATIRENEAHIEELCDRIRSLEINLQELQLERQKTEEHQTDMFKKQEELFLKLELQSQEIADLKLELEKTQVSLHKARENIIDLEKLISEKELQLLSHKQDKDNLLTEINNLKEAEIEYRSKYEWDVKESDAQCKDLNEKLKSALDDLKDLEKENLTLKESVIILSDKNTDIDGKVNQKQQMILLLQGELSSKELELDEKRNMIENLEKLLSEEKELRVQEVQSLHENIMNSSVVRENLESCITDKESALSKLQEKYSALETAYQASCSENNDKETKLTLKIQYLKCEYDEKIREFKANADEKEEEYETRVKALNEKYKNLETEYEKSYLEHKLVMESHRLEMNELRQRYEEELNEARDLVCEKINEMENKMQEMVELSSMEVEEFVKEVRIGAQECLKKIESSLQKGLEDYENETEVKFQEYETKVEMKLKESEKNFNDLTKEASKIENELHKVVCHRDELRISNMEHQLTIVDLQDKVDTLVTELNAAKDSYEAELTLQRNENCTAKKQCKKLKIGITNIQASLEALRKRLLDSENDVEQLTNALQQVKIQKLNAEDKIKIMSRELEMTKESMMQLEKETVRQIDEIRNGLLNKLEEFRLKAERNVGAKEEEILEHRHKIEELSTRIFELTETLSTVEEANTEHEHEIEALTEKLDHQRDCAQIATQQIASLEASNAICQHQIQALTAELDFQKEFSHKASDHIAGLVNVKTNHEREICELATELNAERAKTLKQTKEIAGLINEFDQYKEEIRFVILNYKHDLEAKASEIKHKNWDLSKQDTQEVNEKVTELVSESTNKEENICKQEQKEVNETVAELVSESAIKEEKICEQEQKELSSAVEELRLALDSAVQSKLVETQEHYQREQLETFEAERKELEMKKEAAEGAVRELGARYADILGHQNHKQKIKHKRIIDQLKNDRRQVPGRKQVLQNHNPPNTNGKENVEQTAAPKSPLGSRNVKSLRSIR